jgi:hypothetical protein
VENPLARKGINGAIDSFLANRFLTYLFKDFKKLFCPPRKIETLQA